ncbi:recombination protein O N-terminal domain-containing protein [Mesomycoplasma hyorhinis]|uniref:DNA replication/recombination mediator RecO N-terminal domain-containing protein n=1 Tax=Mesomycoplasma hyorhinis TaxID=2100 RepID=A0ABD6IF65_MESHY|nr:recombination protein O N-terminal domain-containing protein [Mesomycoplasma hyorhinis]MXR43680.1 hypothetical protein [Mesomycoplasma hyorhinis]
MSAEIIKGLILQVYEFQEKDLIVKTITNKRIFSFVALGTRKPESKNKFALLESSISELEIFLSRLNNKLSKLKKATTEISLDLNNSKILEFWRFISFFLNKLEKTSNYFFENLKLAWEIINEQNYLHIVVFLLANHLVLQGHFISFNKCVKCMKNKNLIYFNFSLGGMFCKIHYKNKDLQNISLLKSYYFLSLNLDQYLKFVNTIDNFLIYEQLKLFIEADLYSFPKNLL